MGAQEKTFSAVIVEDEPRSAETLRQMLARNFPDMVITGCADSVEESVELLCEAQPDLAFLDIEIRRGDGFMVLERIPEAKRNFSVIFTTGFHDFALRAFRANAMDYLLKPLDEEELVGSVEKVLQIRRREKKFFHQEEKISQLLNYIDLIQHDEEKILLELKDRAVMMRLNQILWCESEHNYTIFHLISGEQLRVRGNISEFEERLSGKNFFRTHRSCLVNLAFVSEVKKSGDGNAEEKILLSGGIHLDLSQSRQAGLLEALRRKGV